MTSSTRYLSSPTNVQLPTYKLRKSSFLFDPREHISNGTKAIRVSLVELIIIKVEKLTHLQLVSQPDNLDLPLVLSAPLICVARFLNAVYFGFISLTAETALISYLQII